MYMANDISANGVSAEKAEQDLKTAGDMTEKEKLNISNYNGDITIDIPID